MWGRLSAALVEGVVGGAAGAVRAVAMRVSFAAGRRGGPHVGGPTKGGPHVAHVRVCLDWARQLGPSPLLVALPHRVVCSLVGIVADVSRSGLAGHWGGRSG
jgi:hypothetical protein